MTPLTRSSRRAVSWLIDPDARTFEIFELQAGARYLRVLGAAEGVVDVPGCDGLRLDLDALWAEIDRLGG